jgi:hypothetical protein
MGVLGGAAPTPVRVRKLRVWGVHLFFILLGLAVALFVPLLVRHAKVLDGEKNEGGGGQWEY